MSVRLTLKNPWGKPKRRDVVDVVAKFKRGLQLYFICRDVANSTVFVMPGYIGLQYYKYNKSINDLYYADDEFYDIEETEVL
jgi:hypothetical protein